MEKEIEEYLRLKSKATQRICRSGFKNFIMFYQAKYNAGMEHFLDRIFDNFKKPRREQNPIDRKVAERPATLVLAVPAEARKRLLASPL